MKLTYCIDEEFADKFINLLILGVLYGLERKVISIDEAEGFVFKPYMAKVLKEAKLSNKVIELIMAGCELEDVQSLIPHLLDEEISKLREAALLVLSSFPEFGGDIDRELTIK